MTLDYQLGHATGCTVTATDIFKLLTRAGHFAAADLVEPLIAEHNRKAEELTQAVRDGAEVGT